MLKIKTIAAASLAAFLALSAGVASAQFRKPAPAAPAPKAAAPAAPVVSAPAAPAPVLAPPAAPAVEPSPPAVTPKAVKGASAKPATKARTPATPAVAAANIDYLVKAGDLFERAAKARTDRRRDTQ